MAARAIFNPRTVIWLVLTGTAAFCVMLTLTVLGDPAAGNVTISSVFSRSAVGHAALAELLRSQGREVKVNRSRNAVGVADNDLLLMLAPNTAEHDLDHLATLAKHASERHGAVLVALPKWRTSPSAARRGWISAARLISAEQAAKPLAVLGFFADAKVVRGEVFLSRPPPPQQAASRPPSPQQAASPQQVAWRNALTDAAPSVEQPQFIEHEALAPLVSKDGKVLIGEVPNARLAVLADPDLVSNHGLRRGDNAALALALVERLVPPGGAVVFDETLHGFAIVPSIWRLLFQAPYVAATLLAFAAMALTVWRAAARFGAPLDGHAGPAFRGGHGQLIENAGRLLAAGGHGAVVAERYAQMTVAEAHRRLHLPPPPAIPAAFATLNAIGERRGVAARLPVNMDRQRSLALARSCQRWRREMFRDA